MSKSVMDASFILASSRFLSWVIIWHSCFENLLRFLCWALDLLLDSLAVLFYLLCCLLRSVEDTLDVLVLKLLSRFSLTLV